MGWRVQSAALLGNPAESVVALLAALGTRTVEVLATEMLITVGLKAWQFAHVSSVFVIYARIFS